MPLHLDVDLKCFTCGCQECFSLTSQLLDSLCTVQSENYESSFVVNKFSIISPDFVEWFKLFYILCLKFLFFVYILGLHLMYILFCIFVVHPSNILIRFVISSRPFLMENCQ